MATMATVPVYKCRVCGAPVMFTHVSSMNDPKAANLKGFMLNLHKIALCANCRRAQQWWDSIGRGSEYRLNPHVVILNVKDFSQADYYGRKNQG